MTLQSLWAAVVKTTPGMPDWLRVTLATIVVVWVLFALSALLGSLA